MEKRRELLTTTCIRIKPTTLKQLEQIAEQKKRRTSELMRMILESYIEQSNF